MTRNADRRPLVPRLARARLLTPIAHQRIHPARAAAHCRSTRRSPHSSEQPSALTTPLINPRSRATEGRLNAQRAHANDRRCHGCLADFPTAFIRTLHFPRHLNPIDLNQFSVSWGSAFPEPPAGSVKSRAFVIKIFGVCFGRYTCRTPTGATTKTNVRRRKTSACVLTARTARGRCIT